MLKDYPNKIKFIIDGNILELKQIVLSNKIRCGLYFYVKSKTKLHQDLLLTLESLNKLITDKIVKI